MSPAGARSAGPSSWGLGAAAGLLALLGVAMRINNAFRYPKLGFDSNFNWAYIERLMGSWTLPAPDAGWSTAHPPLFYYLGAALARSLGQPGVDASVHAVRLASSGVGLLAVAAAVLLVQRAEPGNLRRAVLAGGLVLLLPVHIYMSAMLSEEILASTFAALCITSVVLTLRADPATQSSWLRAAGIGGLAGLALLTKLSGLLVLLVAVAAYGLHGIRRQQLGAAIGRIGLLVAVAAGVGGWYYLRNWTQYGYLYPQGLGVHQLMFQMPPGERALADYLRIPLSTWTDPQLLAPGLLRSVWGGTYITLWFDGHRHFLPRGGAGVNALGSAILVLAALPTAAFGIGLVRGIRRAVRRLEPGDVALVGLVAATLAGYVLFTWRNPWYATVKASYLLGAAVPCAYYASEVLSQWTQPGRWRSIAVWVALGLLTLGIAAAFTYGPVFAKYEVPGLDWQAVGGS